MERESFKSFGTIQPTAKLINIKCKNLMSYDLAYNVTKEKDLPPISLTSDPKPLIGGATIPVSIFKNPELYKAKDHHKFSFKQHTGSEHNS